VFGEWVFDVEGAFRVSILLAIALSAATAPVEFKPANDPSGPLKLPLIDFICRDRAPSIDKPITVYYLRVEHKDDKNSYYVGTISSDQDMGAREYRGQINQVATFEIEGGATFALRTDKMPAAQIDVIIAKSKLTGRFQHNEWEVDYLCDPLGKSEPNYWNAKLSK
jgi:hypothetical protein